MGAYTLVYLYGVPSHLPKFEVYIFILLLVSQTILYSSTFDFIFNLQNCASGITTRILHSTFHFQQRTLVILTYQIFRAVVVLIRLLQSVNMQLFVFGFIQHPTAIQERITPRVHITFAPSPGVEPLTSPGE